MAVLTKEPEMLQPGEFCEHTMQQNATVAALDLLLHDTAFHCFITGHVKRYKEVCCLLPKINRRKSRVEVMAEGVT